MVLEHYVWLRFAHLLVFAVWLAGAIGALCLWRAQRLASAGESRAWLARGRDVAHQWQRYCLVLMLPIGYLLALQTGVARLPPAFVAVLFGVATVWLGLVAISAGSEARRGRRLVRRIERGWCSVLALGLLWDAYQGLARQGHLFADWLSVKFLLLAVLVGGSVVLRDRPAAYALLTAVAVLAAAYLGIAKPEF